MNISLKRLVFHRNNLKFSSLLLNKKFHYFNHSNDGLNVKQIKSLFCRTAINGNCFSPKPLFCLSKTLSTQLMDSSTYERIADQTLEHLYEELEKLVETNGDLKDSDVCLNNGVITLNLGENGVYVINKQTPNKQIWFSSPLSGPKRFDYINNDWIYKRDGISLFSSLTFELSEILKRRIEIKPIIQ